VRRNSNTDFIGQKALQAIAGQPLTKRFAGFVIDDPDAVLVGRETILRNGEPVGYLTSGGYGYTIGKSIGYGYVRNPEGVSDEFLTDGDYELVIALDRVPAKIGQKTVFDPGQCAGESIDLYPVSDHAVRAMQRLGVVPSSPGIET
jgi:sarcosine dehydrogenase